MIYWILGVGLVAWFYYVTRDRFKLGVWMFNYPVDDTLDAILTRCLESGVKSVRYDNGWYCLVVEFKNGYRMKAWNANKYYSWLDKGTIGLYEWATSRPSARTMVRLKEEIKRYYVGL